MANANTAPQVSEVSFRFNVPTVSTLNEAYSPEFIICGVPWKVGITKINQNGEDWLAIFLRCANTEKSTNWSYAASVSFKLLPFDGDHGIVEGHIRPHIVDSTEHSFARIIRWFDLFNNTKNFVKNDMIRLKIKINVVDSSEENGSKLVFKNTHECVEGCSCKFRLDITNIENLKALRSPNFMWRNTLWYLEVYIDYSSQLGVALTPKNVLTNELSRQIKASVKLISRNVGVKAIEREDTWKFLRGNAFLMSRLVSLDELIKPQNGFIENNSITIEIKLKVDNSDNEGAKRKMTTTSSETKLLKLQCVICFEGFSQQAISFTPCGHMFCSKCIEHSIKLHKRCPSCNGPVKLTELKQAHLPMLVEMMLLQFLIDINETLFNISEWIRRVNGK